MEYWEGGSCIKDAPVYIDSNSQTDIPKFAPKRKGNVAHDGSQFLGLLLEQSSL